MTAGLGNLHRVSYEKVLTPRGLRPPFALRNASWDGRLNVRGYCTLPRVVTNGRKFVFLRLALPPMMRARFAALPKVLSTTGYGAARTLDELAHLQAVAIAGFPHHPSDTGSQRAGYPATYSKGDCEPKKMNWYGKL